MADGDRHDSDRRGGGRAPMAAIAALAVIAVGALAVASCGERDLQFWRRGDASAANACPRPASVTGADEEFNDQEAGVRLLRRAPAGRRRRP